MKRSVRVLLASLLTVLTLTFTAIPASAAQQTGADVSASAGNAVVNTVERAKPSSAFISSIHRLSDEEVEAISDKLSEQSRVYLVELKDGRYTYYMIVDFRMDDGIYFARLPVLRKTSHKLYDRSVKMATEEDADKSPTLMDYTHIVGELGAHFVLYRLTDTLGGESLSGFLGKLYRKSVEANLNIDEVRFPVLIRLFGLLIGE